MRILVTGNNGFLGRKLVEHLMKDRNNQVTEFSTEKNKRDIRNFNDVLEATKGIDSVFHLASVLNYRRKEHEIIATNYVGTKNLIKAATGNKVKNIVFASTQDVYTSSKHDLVSEDEPIKVKILSEYAKSKYLSEQLLVKCKKIKVAIARIAVISGKGMHKSLVSEFVSDALKGKSVHIYGEGKRIYDIVNVDDVVDVLIDMAGKVGLYNIGGGEKNTVSDMAKTIQRFTKCGIKFVENSNEKKGFSLDIIKATSVFRFRPKPFEQQLREMLKYE